MKENLSKNRRPAVFKSQIVKSMGNEAPVDTAVSI